MKCPKCSYLGFETGDRCKNCGYDFSLMAKTHAPEEVEVDLMLHLNEADSTTTPGWLDSIDLHSQAADDVDVSMHAVLEPKPGSEPVSVPRPAPIAALRAVSPLAPAAASAPESRLPLFSPASEEDGDEPLIKLPTTPRPPLAVRKTPDMPRLRAVPRPALRLAREPDPVLEFQEEVTSEEDERSVAPPPIVHIEGETGSPRARLAAALVDNAILFGIDLAVVYLTLRMAGLAMGDWTALPLAPLAAFLLLVKLSYFAAFTAVGGQTIGKMASHLRVVTEQGAPVGGAGAIQRTAVGAISALALGLGFLPALLGSDRRALHDRIAGTRVVSQPSA